MHYLLGTAGHTVYWLQNTVVGWIDGRQGTMPHCRLTTQHNDTTDWRHGTMTHCRRKTQRKDTTDWRHNTMTLQTNDTTQWHYRLTTRHDDTLQTDNTARWHTVYWWHRTMTQCRLMTRHDDKQHTSIVKHTLLLVHCYWCTYMYDLN